MQRISARDAGSRCYGAAVLSADLAMHDLDARHWRNGWELIMPPGLTAPTFALGFVEGTPPRWVKLVIAGAHAQGAVPLPKTAPALDHRGLTALCRELKVEGAIILDTGVIAAVAAEVERHLTIDQDLAAQGLLALRALKRHAGRGVWTEPALLEILPSPPYEAVQRTFDLLVPDDSALVGYVIDDDRRAIYTSAIAIKRGGDLEEVTTHAAIADVISESALARDWQTAHKRVLRAVEDRFARPAIGVFAERATLLRVLTGPGDQLGRELNARALLIEPAPAWLYGLLGGATALAMASRGARALASMLPAAARTRAADLAARAGDAFKSSGAHPFALLGFDPIALWAQVKHFYRR
jgi:hypothetical protein